MAKVNKTLGDYIKDLGLRQEQIDFINDYSEMRAANRFEREALRIVGKPELIGDWTYGGYVDTGFFGGGRCSRGHTLRYVHKAKNKTTGEIIKFGSKCVSDFFDLDPMILKLVQQGVMETNTQIMQSMKKLEHYKTFAEYVKQTDIIFKYNQTTSIMAAQTDGDLVEMVKIGDMGAFIEAELPLPDEYENRINRVFAKNFMKKASEWLKKHPQYVDLVDKAKELVCDSHVKTNHFTVWDKVNKIVMWLNDKDFLSPKQIGLLEKMVANDYYEIDTMFDDLALISNEQLKAHEPKMIQDFVGAYKDWGLSIKQVYVLRKLHKQYTQLIYELKSEAVAS